HEIGLFIGQGRSAQECECIVAIGLLNAFDFACHLVQRLFPADGYETCARLAHQRRLQAIGVLVLHVSRDTLRAEAALVEGKILPRFKSNDSVVLHLELNTALLTTEAAVRLDQPVGLYIRIPSCRRYSVQRGTELRNEFRDRYR